MWHVYDSPSWEMTKPHWVLGPGSHSAPDDFDDNAVSSINWICKSEIIISANEECYIFTSVCVSVCLSVCKQ